MGQRNYTIKRINGLHCTKDWAFTEKAPIDCLPWGNYSMFYPSHAQIIGYDDGFAVRLVSKEPEPVARCTHLNELVCNDSCLEFFFQPDIGDKRYFNFEFNPKGTMYLGLGTCRGNNQKLWLKDYRRLLEVKSLKYDDFWGIEFFIPFTFILQYIPDFTVFPVKMRGNFYKCGDKTPKPHYICWSMIRSDAPDFHRPEFFGDLIFLLI